MTGTWVPTSAAVQQLGRSKKALMRLIEIGVLEPGKHYLRGPYRNSTITWNVEAIVEKLRLVAIGAVPGHGGPRA